MGQMNIKDEALIAEARALAELLGTTGDHSDLYDENGLPL